MDKITIEEIVTAEFESYCEPDRCDGEFLSNGDLKIYLEDLHFWIQDHFKKWKEDRAVVEAAFKYRESGYAEDGDMLFAAIENHRDYKNEAVLDNKDEMEHERNGPTSTLRIDGTPYRIETRVYKIKE